jgi:hypothetical protein
MDQTLHELLYSIPSHASYAATPEELDPEDIPAQRVQGLRGLLASADEEIAIHAARLLCSWGDKEGLQKLGDFVLNRPPLDRGWLPHRLWGYDDTYRHIAYAVGRYWATHADNGDGQEARIAVTPIYIKIIEHSAVQPFEVPLNFLLSNDFTELVPALKESLLRLLELSSSREKIEDVARALLPFDRDFVLTNLAKHGIAAPSNPL